MTTTVMRDSVVGDAWIQQCVQNVPVQRVVDQATGQLTGDILTGPVRLAFPFIFELPKRREGEGDPKYGTTMLFTPYHDFTILYEEYYAVCAREFTDYYDAASGQYYGLHSPFRQQAEKVKMGGYTPGLVFINAGSKFQPQVVDVRGNPVIDPKKVYPGVWAICSINAYAFKDPRKKGVSFGLQSIMLIGDDTKLGGGAPDPNKTFSGVRGAIAPPPVSAGAMAGMPGGQQPPAGPPPGLPGAPPGGTYAAPPASAPGAPPAGGYSMPGTPPAPPAGADPRGPVPAGYSSWAEYDHDMNSL